MSAGCVCGALPSNMDIGVEVQGVLDGICEHICVRAVGTPRVGTGYHYGTIQIGSGLWRTMGQHQAAYMLAYGPIPEGLIVRHKCDNPWCINPFHLEVGTHADNTRDMHERGRHWNQNTYKTHCPRGHALAEDNLVPSKLRVGSRECLICSRDRARQQYLKRKAQEKEGAR